MQGSSITPKLIGLLLILVVGACFVSAEDLARSAARSKTMEKFHLDSYLARQQHRAKNQHHQRHQQKDKLWFHLDDLLSAAEKQSGSDSKSLLQESDRVHKDAKQERDTDTNTAEAGDQNQVTNQVEDEVNQNAEATDAESGSGSVGTDDQLGKSYVKEKKGGSTTVIANRNFMSVMEEAERKPLPPQLAAQEARLEVLEQDKKRQREENHKRNMGSLRNKRKAGEQAKKQADSAAEKEVSKKRVAEEVNKAQEVVAKENERAAQLAKRAEQDAKVLRSKRCKKDYRTPSDNAGQFLFPIFQYPNGWNFVGAWTFENGAVVGDFNGDGRDDFCKLGAEYIHLFISKGDGQYYYPVYRFPAGWNFGWNENVWTTLKALDVNGDKRMDIIRTTSNSQVTLISSGSNEDCWYTNAVIPSTCFKVSSYNYPDFIFENSWSWNSNRALVADFNGDGKSDYARVGASSVRFFISKGDGTFFSPIWRTPDNVDFNDNSGSWTPAAIDFSGDCRTDILMTLGTRNNGLIIKGENECWERNGVIASECIQVTGFSYPNGWNFIHIWTWNSRAFIQGDFNGDGKIDFARLGGTYIHFFISNGDGTFRFPIYPFPDGWNFGFDEGVWTTIPPGDFDGDSRTDVIRSYYTYNHGLMMRGSDDRCWKVDMWIPRDCITISTFRYTAGWYFAGGWSWNKRTTVTGDFNGDGKADFINLSGGTYNHQFLAL